MFDGCSTLSEVTLDRSFYAYDDASELTEPAWVLKEKLTDPNDCSYTPSELKAAMRGKTADEGTYVRSAVRITGTKTLDGELADKDENGNAFRFQLLENGKVLQTVSAQPGGVIRFAPIFYDRGDVGTHTYTVKEVDGGNAEIQYGDSACTITVTVAKNLGTTVVYDTGDIGFSNLTKSFDPGYRLPDTGGMGTVPFYLAGVVIIVSAGALWLYDRRRRCGRG